MTLLSMVQSVAVQVGVNIPTSVISNQATEVLELLTFAQQTGTEMAQAVPWQEITKQTTFTTVAQAEQTGALPADFGRFLNDTIFNRSMRWKIEGPISEEIWQYYKSFNIINPFPSYFMLRENEIHLLPDPSAGQTVAFSYISKNWCASAAGTPQDEWEADTDVGLLSESIMALGIRARWLVAKGMSTADAAWQLYNDQLQKYAARQKAAPILRAGRYRWDYLGWANTPEGNFPGP